MKRAVSISLGSSKRDKSVKVNLNRRKIRNIAKVRQMYWDYIPQYCSCRKMD